MHQQLVVVLLVGLAVSAYGLDLSHAAKRSVVDERGLLSFINDLYAQVIYPPLNHVVTNLALLGAQALAGIYENGIPAPNGRTVYPSEAQLRGFWDDLWNNGLKPPLEQILSSTSLTLAQILANIGVNGINLGIGKRDLTEAETRDFLQSLGNALTDVFTQVIQKPLETALSDGALILAQLLAGLGTQGINLGIGKRDLTEAEMRGFFDSFALALNDVFTQVIQKPLETALADGALMLAQVLAGLGTQGINLSGILGKRDLNDIAARQAELRGFFDDLANGLLSGLQSVWTNVIQNPLQDALQTGALLAAQVLAGIGINGISLPGKRDLTPELRGVVLDGLVEHATGLYQEQVKPLLESAINSVILQLAGVLANFSQGSIGRR
jgi:hypothetical protein